MGDKSAIQWTDATWNPTTGCDRVSPGCANCYALTLAPRLQVMSIAAAAKRGESPKPTDPYMRDGDPKTSGPGFGLMLHPDRLDQPLRWKRPRRIFTNSMSDLFHPEVPDEFLDRVFATMLVARQHTFQILTKRPERMRAYLGEPVDGLTGWERAMVLTAELMEDADHDYLAGSSFPPKHIWVGTSVENARWRTRIDDLRQTPAAVRFLSCEPLLGPLADRDEPWTQAQAATGQLAPFDLTGIDWVIIGGESGPGSRKMDEDWVRDIVAACRRQGVALFVKQMGRVWAERHLGNSGHAGDIAQFPSDLRVREYPA